MTNIVTALILSLRHGLIPASIDFQTTLRANYTFWDYTIYRLHPLCQGGCRFGAYGLPAACDERLRLTFRSLSHLNSGNCLLFAAAVALRVSDPEEWAALLWLDV